MYVNTRKSALFVAASSSLPTVPVGFIEVTDEFTVTPNSVTKEFKRSSPTLGTIDSYADTCHVTIDDTFKLYMRTNNKAGDSLATLPDYDPLLKIGAFEADVGADTVIYKNTQTPIKGSAVFNIDSQEYRATNSCVADITVSGSIGEPLMISSKIKAFLDNKGVPVEHAISPFALSEELLVMMSCSDTITINGVALPVETFKVSMKPTTGESYGLGVKEFSVRDYQVELDVKYNVDDSLYSAEQQALINQTTGSATLNLNTADGTLVDGKSVQISLPSTKTKDFSDAPKNGVVSRTTTFLCRPDASGTNIEIKLGKF